MKTPEQQILKRAEQELARQQTTPQGEVPPMTESVKRSLGIDQPARPGSPIPTEEDYWRNVANRRK